MNFKVVIPARYQSTRLPGKVLLEVNGKPIIQYVYENACKSNADEVIIATDDQRIIDAAKKFNANICLTSIQHASGTDRIAEVAEKNAWNDDVVIVNVQGDEPLMPPENIKQVAENLVNDADVSMSTLCAEILDKKEYENPNVVKVCFDEKNHALIFSRKTKSFNRFNKDKVSIFRHLGVYAYYVEFLKIYTKLHTSDGEVRESLEQLRALDNNYKIYVDICRSPTGIGIDTLEDYEYFQQIM